MSTLSTSFFNFMFSFIVSSTIFVVSIFSPPNYQLHIIEERRGSSARYSSTSSASLSNQRARHKQQCKPLASALEEVSLKGSLVERVAALETRVMQVNQVSYSAVPFTN